MYMRHYKMRHPVLFIFIIVVLQLPACRSNRQLSAIHSYLNAYTIGQKEKYMAENYRSFFEKKAGDGKNKTDALKSFSKWDAPLHPDIKILSSSYRENKWVISFIEQNDFTKLIGFPGWKATDSIKINNRGLIEEIIYMPDESNPNYKQWLKPAVDWLRQNKPGELNEVYQDGKLIQNESSARKWVELLTEWKEKSKNG